MTIATPDTAKEKHAAGRERQLDIAARDLSRQIVRHYDGVWPMKIHFWNVDTLGQAPLAARMRASGWKITFSPFESCSFGDAIVEPLDC
jgi:hypothetical protein